MDKDLERGPQEVGESRSCSKNESEPDNSRRDERRGVSNESPKHGLLTLTVGILNSKILSNTTVGVIEGANTD